MLPQEVTCNLSFKPGSVRQEIPDDLLCRGSGARSWRRARQHKLGAYLAIDLNAARALAGKALRAVAEGKDPAAPSANTMLMTIAWMFLPRTIAMLDMLALQIDQPRYPANAASRAVTPISPAAQKFRRLILCNALDNSVTVADSPMPALMLGRRHIADMNQNTAEPHAVTIIAVSMDDLITAPDGFGDRPRL